MMKQPKYRQPANKTRHLDMAAQTRVLSLEMILLILLWYLRCAPRGRSSWGRPGDYTGGLLQWQLAQDPKKSSPRPGVAVAGPPMAFTAQQSTEHNHHNCHSHTRGRRARARHPSQQCQP